MDVSEVKVLARRANGMLFVTPVFILLSGFALVYSILVLADVIVPDKDVLWAIYAFSYTGGRHSYYYNSYSRKVDRFNSAWNEEFVYDNNIFDNDYIVTFVSSFDLILWQCIISWSLYFFGLLIPFLDRLFTPRTIMEYDDFGIYIYRTGNPVTLLRYEDLWSTYAEEDFENAEFCYRRGFYRYRNIKVTNPFWGIFKTGSIRIEVPDGFINLGGIYHVKEVEREIKRMVKKNRQEFIEEMEENIKENQRQRELEELAKHNPNT